MEVRKMAKLEDYVISIPDFPQEGIIFRDVTGILNHADGIQMSINGMVEKLKDVDFDVVVGAESRGFIFGMPVAYAMNKPFVPIRKKGKLPRATIEESYDLEYGKATVEIHKDDIRPGMKAVIVDDLIATGGTCEASIRLLERLGAKVVKAVFVMELAGLEGRKNLEGYDVESLICYEGK